MRRALIALIILHATLLYNFCFAGVGISVSPNSWNAGTGASGDYTTWTSATLADDGFFTVQNVGDSNGSIRIRATNSINWSLGTSAGVNTFALQWGKTTQQGNQPQWNSTTLLDSTMFTLNALASSKFDLRFQSPSQINPIITNTQNTNVTVGIEPLAAVATNYIFLREWGSVGTGDGQFSAPWGIAIDATENVYVVDSANNRVQKFTSNGTFITKWGSLGSGIGQFNRPRGIAVDASGNVYVTDQNNNRIQKFTSNGAFITQWGSVGTGDGQFFSPWGVAVDSSGNIYIAEFGGNRIQKFTADGTFILRWGSAGSGDGQFAGNIEGISSDTSGNIYVTDPLNSRIQKFTSNGTFITKWGSQGSADGQFMQGPRGIAIDASNNVYTVEANEIQKFDSSGIFISKWTSPPGPEGDSDIPTVAVDMAGDVYISDINGNRVQVFTPQF